MWTSHEDPDDNELRQACERVRWILGGGFQGSELIVARAALRIDRTYTSHVQNKKRGESIKARNPQVSHQPRFTPKQILELLVMSELEKEEKKQEAPGHDLTHDDWIKRLCKHLIKHSLTHTSYHAAVAVGRILCTYKANEIRGMYLLVAYDRALKKSDPECCRAKNSLRRSVAHRFDIDEEDLFKERSCDRLTDSDRRVPLTIQSLDRFAPAGGIIPEEYSWESNDNEDPHADSVIEVERMSRFFRITNKFNPLAKAANLKPFEESVKELKNWWPFSPDAGTKKNGNDGGNGSDGGQYNLKEIRDHVARERKRRRRVSPGSLTIRVDGKDQATINLSEQEHEATLEADATIVDVVGRDDQGDVVLATYVLTYDDQPRTEEWSADLPRSQKLLCTFEYDEEYRVHARFTLTNTKQIVATLQDREYPASRISSALSPAWLKAQIVLSFAGKALISMAVVLAALIYVNMQQSLNNQRTMHDLNLAYLQTFSRDIGSAEPGQRLRAISVYREMSPQLAAPLAPIAAEADPMTATNRSVEILADRSQDPQTRSVAEQSRRRIMGDFRIEEPSYGSKVNVRQVVRGTTPFPEMRHYIIVTTPQGVDFVAGEARVSGDTWEGVATFGSAGVGRGEKFYVRVIATRTSLPEGPFAGMADAIASDSIPVMRDP